MDSFFSPATVCVPGASSKPLSIGYELLATMKKSGFTGTVLPVNPKADEILGYRCYASIQALPTVPDLSIILTPKQSVYATVEELLKLGCRAFIVITAGFRETGEEGRKNEQALVALVKSYGAFMTGPNCMGVINTDPSVRLNATFVAEQPVGGNAGFLSQSGALGAAVLNSLRLTGYKFKHFVSLGNKAHLTENEVTAYWLGSNAISSVGMYLESFSGGEDFLKMLFGSPAEKPLFVLKAGNSDSGRKAAASHTGALGASTDVVNAVLKQSGCIRVKSVSELFNSIRGYEAFPLPKGNRTAIVTNAGGPAILCVDACDANGLTLAQLSEETKTKLREFVHPEGSVNNPVDLLPGGNAEQYTRAADLLLQDESVDSVIIIFVEPVMVQPQGVISGVNSIASDKPLLTSVLPLPEFWQTDYEQLTGGKPLFRTTEEPAEVIKNLLQFYNRKTKQSRIEPAQQQLQINEAGPGMLDAATTSRLLQQYKLPVSRQELYSPDEVLNMDVPFPVVLKGVSAQLVHKTEHKAVAVNLKNKEEFEAEVVAMKQRLSFCGDLRFLVQPFHTPVMEVLIGGMRDSSFGPVIMFGTGGKYVEVFADRAIRSAYLSDSDIAEMLNETKAGKILQGTRGEKPADTAAIKLLIKQTAQLLLDYPEITEMDLNPAIITSEGKPVIVDARVIVG